MSFIKRILQKILKRRVLFTTLFPPLLLVISIILFYFLKTQSPKGIILQIGGGALLSLIIFFLFNEKKKVGIPILFQKIKISPFLENNKDRIYFFLVIIFLLWASILIFHNLGSQDIYHDEQFHISVLNSLEHNHGFKKSNPITNQPRGNYNRGFITNSINYIISSLVGKTPFALRFFSALMGVFSLLLIYLVFKDISKLAAFLTMIGSIFSIPILFLSRFLRPYPIAMFFYVISFWLVKKVTDEFCSNKINKQNIFKYLFALLVSIIGAFQASQLTKILIPILVFYFIYFTGKKFKLVKKIIKENLVYFILVISSLFLILYFLNLKNILALDILFKQAKNFLSLEKLNNPTIRYIKYVFVDYIKLPFFYILFYILGCVVLFLEGITEDKPEKFLILLFGLVPFFAYTFLMDRFEDFRYIYFSIPFVYFISTYTFIRLLNYLDSKRILKLKKNYTPILITIIFLIFIFHPVLPINKNIPGTIKAPSVWGTNEGKKILHRRAVAPEYSKVFSYLNKIQKKGDVIILREGLHYYLKPTDGVSYYKLKPWSGNLKVKNLRTGKKKDFFKLIKEPNRVFFEAAYVHSINKNILNYLLNNCQNTSSKLKIKKYNYNSFYNNRFYFPNLYLCK